MNVHAAKVLSSRVQFNHVIGGSGGDFQERKRHDTVVKWTHRQADKVTNLQGAGLQGAKCNLGLGLSV